MPTPVIPPTCHILSLDEEIGRTINESYTSQLRCLFNYLGSSQSIIAFKRALCDLRRRKCEDSLVLKGARSDADHLRIVKRLRENTAADSLLMICHTVRLFHDDTDNLIRCPGSFVIQTQTSFGRSRGTAIGNPLSLTKAAITDRKIAIASGALPQSAVGWSPQTAVAVTLVCLGVGLVLALIAFMQSRRGQSLNGPTKFLARAPLALVAIVVLIFFLRAMTGL